MKKQIYVNISVKDLKKSIEFFSKLGFKFRQEFTNEQSTCMIVEENIFFMLLEEETFSGFLPGRKICDTSNNTEALMGISANSREEVDEMIENVIEAGGKKYRDSFDHGWMYGQSFLDLDGHVWEVFYINEDEMPEEMKNKIM